MSTHPRARRAPRLLSGLAALALASASLAATTPAQAAPVTAPNYVERPAGVVTSDALPTTQIDGIAWDQVIVGDTVYVGGRFANARPAGAAAGTNLVPRANLLAYDLATGVLRPDFAPVTDGEVRVLAVSPDHTRLYVGGTFTTVNGQPRSNVAAINLVDGSLVADFAPRVSKEVDAIVVTDDTVYLGGAYLSVNGTPRSRLSAVTLKGELLPWAPRADNTVRSIALTPNGSKLALGGSFGTIDGTFTPGLAFVDPTTGATSPFAATQVVQNHGDSAGIYSLKSDGKNLLATGWWYGGTGNFEGVLSADPETGAIRWMADCHGDTYDATTIGDYTYSVSHHHDCSNIGSFGEQSPRAHEYAQAFTDRATGTVGHDTAGGQYHDFFGQPRPTQVAWAPDLTAGNVSGAWQAAWTAESNDTYLVLGGEFGKVNGVGQQGLVRFALPGTAPSTSGPKYTWNWTPTATVAGTTTKISWPANVDRDGMRLTYRLYRTDRPGEPLATLSAESTWFDRPQLGWFDRDLVPGTTYTYYVTATDADGNVATSVKVKATAVAGSPDNAYNAAVTADGPSHYWRLREAPGTARSVDWASSNDLVLGTGVALGQPGAVREGDTAATFDGTAAAESHTVDAEKAPDTFSQELWFRSTSTTGGKLLGFGNAATGTSRTYDRHVYLDDAGHVLFGVFQGGARAVASPQSYTDGKWHHVVTTLGPAGQALWVDGQKVAGDTSVTRAEAGAVGHWRVGGDILSGWPGAPSSTDVAATIDEVAVYPTVLTDGQIAAHFAAATRVANQAPTAAFASSCAAATCSVDAAASSDADGSVKAWQWDFGDGTTGQGQAAKHTYAASGTYTVTLTVTDDRGASASTSRQVTVVVPTPPVAAFTPSCTFLDCTFDASASAATTGTLVSRSWDFGDGTTSTEAAPRHHYAGPGDHTVTLTVVDSNGLRATTSHVVHVVEPPNQAPKAAFTHRELGLAAQFDASSSSDADGTVVGHQWSFGDGTTGSGRVVQHTYARPGTYTVTLTVTDDDGARSTTVQQVRVDRRRLAADDFSTPGAGWASADTGGVWTHPHQPAAFSRVGGRGVVRAARNTTATAVLAGVRAQDATMTADLSFDRRPAGAVSATLLQRWSAQGSYSLGVRYKSNGQLQLVAQRTLGATTTTLAEVPVRTVQYRPGMVLHVAFTVDGTGTTRLSGVVWADGQARPVAPQVTVADSSAALQRAGGVGMGVTAQGGRPVPPVVVGVDNLLVVEG